MVYEGITAVTSLKDGSTHRIELHINIITNISLEMYRPLQMEISCQTCNLHYMDVTLNDYWVRRDNTGRFYNEVETVDAHGIVVMQIAPIVKIRTLMKRSAKIIHEMYEVGCTCYEDECSVCDACIKNKGKCFKDGYRIE